MKRIVLLLPILFLFFACPVEEEDPRPYDGNWSTLGGLVTLELSKGSFEKNYNNEAITKGTVTDVDTNTITFVTTHAKISDTWYPAEQVDQTWDWTLSSDSNTLTLTDPNSVYPQEVYTK